MSATLVTSQRILVRGIVQGVGFRPFVYRLAMRHALAGWVANRSGDVEIVVEGPPDVMAAFIQQLQSEAPPLARIDTLDVTESAPTNADVFKIYSSRPVAGPFQQGDKGQPVPADTSICDDCLRELFDPSDRRYCYPFINCTNCGPRFTIIDAVPYDRQQTTMAAFRMCEDCQREYDDPASRRFHAQPNACPVCGPALSLIDSNGQHLAQGDPLAATASLLAAGHVVAVKGLGGYHLAVDATNETSVARLRLRKHREEKPLAVMVRDLKTARSLCFVDECEERLLIGSRRPIVLLRRRYTCRVAESVAPGRHELGVMLPYTPLHYLLMEEFAAAMSKSPVLVLTSGNISDEPIAFEDNDAFERLQPIADYFLTHNRRIQTRCDDTVARVIGRSGGFQPPRVSRRLSSGETQQDEAPEVRKHLNRVIILRRSRGYTPEPIPLPFKLDEPVLAVGAHLKNSFCLGFGGNALPGPHVGDLDNYPAYQSFVAGIEHYRQLFGVSPQVVAHDLHPEYLSTKYAIEQKEAQRIGVQHHHAHVASVMAEHGLHGPVIGVAFDGTGYGLDGRIWGAEFLIADYAEFTRAAHLKYVPLPGGEQAIREPWRMAGVYLSECFGPQFPELDLQFTESLPDEKWRVLEQMIDAGVNCPLASSMGRLFDAVSALLTGRQTVSYEGQAAVELEMLVERCSDDDGYCFALEQGAPLVIDPLPVIRGVVNDLLRQVPTATIAARFHHAVVNHIVEVCSFLRHENGLDCVALSGGVFQNAYLLEQSLSRLREAGFVVYTNNRVPPNDGGIALGQLAVAAAILGAM